MTTYKFWIILWDKAYGIFNYVYNVDAVTLPSAFAILQLQLAELLHKHPEFVRFTVNNCNQVSTDNGCCAPSEDCPPGLPIRN